MYGLGVLRGVGVVFQHFVDTLLDDLRWFGHRYRDPAAFKARQGARARGIFTVPYPDEKLIIPEEFRYLPILIYEDKAGVQTYRCTACGICAKVCPPQCIWIERATDPATGKPVATPKEFSIDIDICMSCGFCAEYCPFDAIKMDHAFEIATYTRADRSHLWNKATLGRPLTYYASIRPANYAREAAARAEKEAKQAAAKLPGT